MAHRTVLHPDAMLRGDTVEAVLERMTASVKPPLSSRRAPGVRGVPGPAAVEA
jgi:hypothetical protein